MDLVLNSGRPLDNGSGPAYTSWSQRVGRLSDRAQGDSTSVNNHISKPSLRQRKCFCVPQRWWYDSQRADWTSNRFRLCWWGVSAESRHVGAEDVRNWRSQDVDGLRARHYRSAGAQPARPGNVPVLQRESEVEEHELTHLPFRNWCRHCARESSPRRRVEVRH